MDLIDNSLTQAVKESHVRYSKSFVHWETEDKARLDKRMYQTLHMLYAARNCALSLVPPDFQSIPLLDGQIQRVTGKLRQISGQVITAFQFMPDLTLLKVAHYRPPWTASTWSTPATPSTTAPMTR
jgi:hypothetical protein